MAWQTAVTDASTRTAHWWPRWAQNLPAGRIRLCPASLCLSSSAPTTHLPNRTPPLRCAARQVIPIYGRGGNEDPRSKVKEGLEPAEAAVPRRPAGQRPVPVVVRAAAGWRGRRGSAGWGIVPCVLLLA